MKKIITALIAMVLCIGLVFAATTTITPADKPAVTEKGTVIVHTEGQYVSVETENKELYQATGLNDAVIQVRNEETIKNLEQVMTQLRTEEQTQLQKMENKVVTETKEGFEVKGTEEGKFLGLFKHNYERTYKISNEGEVTENRHFFQWMWSFG